MLQPSDHALRAALLARFASDPRTASSELRVGVSEGIVHLAGAVANIAIRELAAELAAGLPGIRGVVNRIEAPGAPPPARIIHLNFEEERGNHTHDKISE